MQEEGADAGGGGCWNSNEVVAVEREEEASSS